MKRCRFLAISLILCVVFPMVLNADTLEDAKAAVSIGDYQKAVGLLQPMAEQGDEEAQTRLGAMYINGQGVEQDVGKGLSLVMKAATRGNGTARRIAFKVYLDLLEQGNTSILFNLGYMCLEGWGGDHDAGDCMEWLKSAGRSGHGQSLKLLEKIYTEGLYGIAPDEESAAQWRNLKNGYAAGLDGEWKGSVYMGEDVAPMEFTYQFKTEGERLTGSSSGYGGIGYGEGKKWIQHGRIDGNDFSFSLKAEFGAAEIEYTGIFWGDRIELSYTTKASGHRSSHTRSLNNRFGDSDDGENPTFTLNARRVE